MKSVSSPWLLAIRPQTLTAGAVPVLVGSALAMRAGAFRAGPALAALAGALLLQIGTNLANDVDDFERGADTAERLGPARVTQSGLLSARAVRCAAWMAFAAAAVAGLYLTAVAGWPIVVLGLAAIASGWAYTGGPWPLGYNGLGDLFVMIFFGFAAVVGTYYVQAGETSALAWLLAVPIGTLATAILVVNNTRDAETDRAAGKRTVAVRFGVGAARGEYVALVAVAFSVPLAVWLGGALSGAILLPWLTLPVAVSITRRLRRASDGASFNRALVDTARLHGVFGLLLAVGLVV